MSPSTPASPSHFPVSITASAPFPTFFSAPASSFTSIAIPIPARNPRLERRLFLELVVDGLELRLLLRLRGGFDKFGEEGGGVFWNVVWLFFRCK